MRPARRQLLLTVLAAVAGLAVAVALATLTSKISSQRIGLAGAPETAGRELVTPASTSTTSTSTSTSTTTTTTTGTTTKHIPSTKTVTVAPRTVTIPTATATTPASTSGSHRNHDDHGRREGSDD